MSEMTILTEYRTKPGKRDELFDAIRQLLAHPKTSGQDVVVWSTSTTERNVSFLFQYWSEAEGFADLAITDWYAEYVTTVDQLVTTPPIITVTVPVLIEGLSSPRL
jgi:hypothetical protein